MTSSAPTTAQIQAVADDLLAEARAGNARPSISALAERAGVTRPTLYRNYPSVVTRFRADNAKLSTVVSPAAEDATTPQPTPLQELRDRITTLRHENEQLRLHVELYEEHIRRLTVENTRLTAELARYADIAHLTSHRPRSTSR